MILLAVQIGYAQDLPRIIKPSPEASALFRYQDYPMDYSTGLPQISIPLFDVQSGSLDVPISLSYHASGRKVYDQDGPVALGWNLNAGGMITREIYGAVDLGSTPGTFKFPYPFKVTNLGNSSDLVYFEKLMHFDKNTDDVDVSKWLDGEYDVFSYYFNNSSGKFIFKDSNNVKSPRLMPYKPYVITPYYTTNGLTNIDIIDDKGILYKFTGSETTQQAQSPIETVPATTGYVLTSIISADKADTISFIYAAFAQTRTTISQQIVWNDAEQGLNGQPNDIVPEGPSSTETTSHDPYQIARLTEIDYRQGKVLFNLVSSSDKVDKITIVNNDNETLKTIQLYRSTMDNMAEVGYSTNKLDSLVFKDRNSVSIESYAFDYYPSYNASPSLNVRYRDWWGYYNGSGQHDMVPYYTNLEKKFFNGVNYTTNNTIGNPAYNRTPNLQGLESGILKKIRYPTGGTTTFTFENNRYYNYTTGQSTAGPGLRVSQIRTDDSNGNASLKTYKYGDAESGYGQLDMAPDISNMSVETIFNHYRSNSSESNYSYRTRTFNSDFLPGVSPIAARPVVYTTVTEYQGTPTDNIGKTVYTYDYAGWSPANMPVFETVTMQKYHTHNFDYIKVPSLTTRTDYKNVSSTGIPAYQVRRIIQNGYNLTTLETVNALHVQRVHTIPQAERPIDGPGVFAEPYAALYLTPAVNIYTYSDYQIPVGVKNLATAVETFYNDDGSTTVNSKSFTYNSLQLLSQISRNSSDGASIVEQTRYPGDYTGNSVLSQMSGLNMVSFPVEQTSLKNSTVLKAVRTNYFNWGSTVPMLAPQTVDVKKGTNSYETRLHYYNYDLKGNPVTLSKENDVLHSYIWDYKKIYPIAEVVNAGSTEIAYTSFEADGTGGWSGVVAANIKNDVAGITGRKYYTLGTGTLSFTGLTPANSYIVSYWSRTGACTVSGTAAPGWPKTLATTTINGVSWTCYEHKISNTATITVGGGVSIDELRLYPASAQMTTYTYQPLTGISTKCEVNNRITFYEYDGFGRLLLIRDLNGQIIKTFDYKIRSVAP